MIRSALPLFIVSLLTLTACDRSKDEKPAAEKEDPTVSAAKGADQKEEAQPAAKADEPSAADPEENTEPEGSDDSEESDEE
jgi:hypothetical protein